MLVGWISLSGAVLDFLIRRRVETVFVTPTGRFRARLLLDEHRHVELRRAQYLQLSRPEIALAAARAIVRAKAANMYQLLMSRARILADPEVRVAAARLKVAVAGVDKAADMPSLRGHEGLATRIYYQVFGRLIRNEDFSFSGRNRRPPRDPVNALLSFVYTLLTNEVLSAVKVCGLDPYMGSLHEISYGRPSLACDLVEEYRAVLGDRLVLGLINRRMIGSGDFIRRKNAPKSFADEAEMKKKRPVEMKPAVCRTFIASYEEMMARKLTDPQSGSKTTWRLFILSQVRRFGDSLMDLQTPYQPLAWKG
jgi:CRISPR-associated protein Cas1